MHPSSFSLFTNFCKFSQYLQTLRAAHLHTLPYTPASLFLSSQIFAKIANTNFLTYQSPALTPAHLLTSFHSANFGKNSQTPYSPPTTHLHSLQLISSFIFHSLQILCKILHSTHHALLSSPTLPLHPFSPPTIPSTPTFKKRPPGRARISRPTDQKRSSAGAAGARR